MTRFLHAAALLLLAAPLAGCGMASGNGEDFTVEAAVSPAAVMSQLSAVRWEEGRMLFGELPVKVERPGDGQIAWVFKTTQHPGDAGERGEIALRLEPTDDGKHTLIHGAVDLPEVRIMMGKAGMVLSEDKAAAEFRRILGHLAEHLKQHSSTSGDVRELGQGISAIAVIADYRLQARANEMQRHPEAFSGMMDGYDGDAADDEASDDHDSADRDDAAGEDRDAARDRYERAHESRDGSQEDGAGEDDDETE